MIYKGIIFKADPFSYNLEFDDRITLVGGDSGTGKTFLYGLLKDIRLTEEYNAIKQYMLFLQNCDGLNVSDKSFKVLKFDNYRITLAEEL